MKNIFLVLAAVTFSFGPLSARAGTAEIAHCGNQRMEVRVTEVSVNPSSAFIVISVRGADGSVIGYDAPMKEVDPASFHIQGRASNGTWAKFTRQGSMAVLETSGRSRARLVCAAQK